VHYLGGIAKLCIPKLPQIIDAKTKVLERETRLEFTLHLFEKLKYFRDPVRLLYRFRRFGNFAPYDTPPAHQKSNVIPLMYLGMYPREAPWQYSLYLRLRDRLS
jgi:hypothetical protein